MGWLSEGLNWVVSHPVDIGVAWFLLDKVVEITPWTEDDKILEAMRSAYHKLTNKDPADVVNK